MQFDLPVKVYQEKNCVLAHQEELAGFGQKALVVTGQHSAKKNGALADVEEALRAQNREYVIYDKIEENPSIETVMDARDFALKQGADYVIGIGGGSPLDASKAIALMMWNSKRDADLLYSKEDVQACPVVAIPTTCGTGSEVTPYAILTIHKKRTKSSIPYRIYPKMALIDGKYLAFASKKIIANTAIDALAHCVESYCCRKATDYSRMCSGTGMEVWSRSKRVILGKKEPDEQDLQNLLCASTMAGMAITHTGTSMPHAASYKITYENRVPHGKAVGTFLAAFLRRTDEQLQKQVLEKIGMNSCEELHAFIIQATGITSVEAAFVDEAVEQLLQNTAKLASCPFEVNAECMKEVYKESCLIV